jgi:hypothetical protein
MVVGIEGNLKWFFEIGHVCLGEFSNSGVVTVTGPFHKRFHSCEYLKRKGSVIAAFLLKCIIETLK